MRLFYYLLNNKLILYELEIIKSSKIVVAKNI